MEKDKEKLTESINWRNIKEILYKILIRVSLLLSFIFLLNLFLKIIREKKVC